MGDTYFWGQLDAAKDHPLRATKLQRVASGSH
jgi:hypothetical protein